MKPTNVFVLSTGVRLPSNKSVYSYFLDLDSGNFIAWDSLIPTSTSLIEKGAVITIGDSLMGGGASKQTGGDGEIVPTVDTVRYSFLAALLLLNKNPVLITGKRYWQYQDLALVW